MSIYFLKKSITIVGLAIIPISTMGATTQQGQPAPFYRTMSEAHTAGINPVKEPSTVSSSIQVSTIIDEPKPSSSSLFENINKRAILGLLLIFIGLGLYLKNGKGN